jgi:hypothetical protein
MFDEALTAVTVFGMAVTVLGVAMVRPGSIQK